MKETHVLNCYRNRGSKHHSAGAAVSRPGLPAD